MSNIDPKDHIGLVKFYVDCFLADNRWARHIADDIYGECFIELCEQANRDLYDPEKGAFSTWFKSRARYAIAKVIDKQITSVTLPRHFHYRYGYLPTSYGFASDTEDFDPRTRRIDDIVSTEPEDVVKGSDAERVTRLLNSALACLTDKNRDSVIQHFGLFGAEEKGFAEIAKEQGVSRQAIEQRVQNSLVKIKNEIYDSGDERLLMAFLEK